jgi:hypothetical protein
VGVGEKIISCISIPELEIYYLKNFKPSVNRALW